MRLSSLRSFAMCAALLAAAPALATSPVPVVIGPSRDGATYDLQRKVNALLGAGQLDVRSEYLGARPGDPDPWFWTNPGTPMQLQLVDRKSHDFLVGWYGEGARSPAFDDEDDDEEEVLGGIVLDSGRKKGATVTFSVPASIRRFGLFILDGRDDDAVGPLRHRTNRSLNAPGPNGSGAVHAPYDGDLQLLVYDVARWLGPRTWLVAGEISDSGGRVGCDDDDPTDNDFSDVLFTISGASVTPTIPTTFGRVKRLFR